MICLSLNKISVLFFSALNLFKSGDPQKGYLANSADLDQTPQNAATDQSSTVCK